jgi:hypothetical protein
MPMEIILDQNPFPSSGDVENVLLEVQAIVIAVLFSLVPTMQLIR